MSGRGGTEREWVNKLKLKFSVEGQTGASMNGDCEVCDPSSVRKIPPEKSKLTQTLSAHTNQQRISGAKSEKLIPEDVQKTRPVSLPLLNFEGPVQYLTHRAQVEAWCGRIPGDAVLGFDTEWKPSWEAGVPPNKTALVQFCFPLNHGLVHHCLLSFCVTWTCRFVC